MHDGKLGCTWEQGSHNVDVVILYIRFPLWDHCICMVGNINSYYPSTFILLISSLYSSSFSWVFPVFTHSFSSSFNLLIFPGLTFILLLSLAGIHSIPGLSLFFLPASLLSWCLCLHLPCQLPLSAHSLCFPILLPFPLERLHQQSTLPLVLLV